MSLAPPPAPPYLLPPPRRHPAPAARPPRGRGAGRPAASCRRLRLLLLPGPTVPYSSFWRRRPCFPRRLPPSGSGSRGRHRPGERRGRPLPAASALRSAMVRPWRALQRARGWRALAGLRERPDKFGGVSVDLAQLGPPRRLERAAFGRWLRGKCRGGGPGWGPGAGGWGAVGPPLGAWSREWAPLSRLSLRGAGGGRRPPHRHTHTDTHTDAIRGPVVEGVGRSEQRPVSPRLRAEAKVKAVIFLCKRQTVARKTARWQCPLSGRC